MGALRQFDVSTQERRWHSRLSLEANGRVMLDDGREFPCRTIDISLGGLALETRAKAGLGDRVIVYLDHFGRLEGRVVRVAMDGFALRLALPNAKRKRLTDLLMWHANRADVGAEEDRRHQRIVPRSDRTLIERLDRTTTPARIVDVSISGACIAVADRPPVGDRVVVGRTTCTVVRHCPDGIAVQFLRAIPRDSFNEGLVL